MENAPNSSSRRNSPPVLHRGFVLDPEPALVKATAILVGGIATFGLAAFWLKEPSQYSGMAAALVGVVASVAGLVACSRGHHRATALALAITTWVVIAVGNLDQPGASGFVIASLVAGLLLGPGAMVLAAVGGSGFLVVSGVVGEGIAAWGHHVVMLLGGASLAALVSHQVTRALGRERETTRRYRTLIEDQPLGVFATDLDMNITVANQAHADLFGFSSPEDVIGRNLRDGTILEVPQIRDLIDQVLAGRHGVVEAALTSIRNKKITVRIHGAPIRDDAGRVVGGQAICEDVSARVEAERALHESEARLRAITEGDIDQVTEIRGDGSQVFVSPNTKRLFGVDSVSADHVEREDLERMLEAGTRVRKSLQPEQLEYRIRDGAGATRWVESSLSPFVTAEGEQRLIIVSRDVTQRRRLEEDLGQAQKMEAIGQLAAGVAHDFNNLLTVIVSHAEVLGSSASLSPGDRDSAGEILAASERATGLVRQLLTFSRRQPIEARSIPFDATISDLEDILRRLLDAKVELEFVLDAGSSHILCDPIRLEQLVVNLALNARDAMPDGGLLRIATATEPGSVVLQVSDTGLGMSEATRARIFEPFFTTKSVGEGTGLGLATAYAIVEQTGGEIDVESVEQQGSVFTVRLPCAQPEATVTGGPDEERRQAGNSKVTILLAEDEKEVRAVARAALQSAGHIVLEASDGEEALRVARLHGRIDAVVTDVSMPRRDGLWLTEELRASRPDLPVLLISGYQTTPDAELPAPLLTKPFTLAQLCRAVDDLLAERSNPQA